MYVGIFKLGFTRMTKYFWTFFIVFLVIMIFLLGDFIIPILKSKAESIVRFADSKLWILIAAAGIILYFYLYKYAIKVKELSEEV